MVRRATGGFAILHTDELTYSIATRPDDPRADGAILDAYRKLSQGLLAGLRLLGLAPAMNPVVPGGVHNASAACFEVPSAYEIVVNDKKLMGSAQARPFGRVLQHGSLPLTGDIARVVPYLAYEREEERAALATHLRERATTISDALGRAVSYDEAAEAMARGFAAALNLTFEPGDPHRRSWRWRRAAGGEDCGSGVALSAPPLKGRRGARGRNGHSVYSPSRFREGARGRGRWMATDLSLARDPPLPEGRQRQNQRGG